jgi:hypothetical protein
MANEELKSVGDMGDETRLTEDRSYAEVLIFQGGLLTFEGRAKWKDMQITQWFFN